MAAGGAVGLVIGATVSPTAAAVCATVGGIYGLLPDLDQPRKVRIGNRVVPGSKATQYFVALVVGFSIVGVVAWYLGAPPEAAVAAASTPLILRVAGWATGHRQATHTVLAGLLIPLATTWWLYYVSKQAFVLLFAAAAGGYLSHLVLDH